MSDNEYQVYDFKKAAAYDDSALALRQWLGGCSQVMSDQWSRITGFELTVALSDICTRTYEQTMEGVTKHCGGFVRRIEGVEAISLWHISRENMLAVAAEMLGQPQGDDSEDEHTLSELELSLCTLFFENLAQALRESWPGRNPLKMSVESEEGVQLNPVGLRLFRSRDLVAYTRLLIQLDRGEIAVNWILAKHHMTALLGQVADRRKKTSTATTTDEVVDQLPIEVIARLGCKQISMRQLMDLNVGDLFVLDQKITDPVDVTIGGKPAYKGWPGRVGQMQGLEIVRCL